MKKSLTLLALALGISTSFAQELKSKKEEMILPEAGDWGLAIDADPFLRYAGNFFGKTTTNAAPTFNFFTTANTITGRYFHARKERCLRTEVARMFNSDHMIIFILFSFHATHSTLPFLL